MLRDPTSRGLYVRAGGTTRSRAFFFSAPLNFFANRFTEGEVVRAAAFGKMAARSDAAR